MFTAASALLSRFVLIQAIPRRDKVVAGLAASVDLAALGLMVATEVDLVAKVVFLLNHFVMGDNDDRSALIATPNRRAFSHKNYLLRGNRKKKPRHIGIE